MDPTKEPISPAQALRPVRIIGAAIGRGAQDPRTEYGPEKLEEWGFAARLRAAGLDADWGATLFPHYGRKLAEPVPIVAEFDWRLMQAVSRTLADGAFPLVLGGDHSCAVGTWSGVSRSLSGWGPLGLIWLDAHMDSHTPQTTPSGAIHGMPLACLLGFGEPALVELGGVKPKLLPQHVCLVGVRSFEAGESDLLRTLNVRVYYMDEVNRRGLDAVLQEALTFVQEGTAGFGLSFDLDAVDPQDAPGVGSPAPGGIRAADAVAALRLLRRQPGLLALEISEYNPFLDREGRTADLIQELVVAALG